MCRRPRGRTNSQTRSSSLVPRPHGFRRLAARQPHGPPTGRAARHPVALGKLHRTGRFALPGGGPVGGLARNRRADRLGRLPARHRHQAQRTAATLPAAAPRIGRPRVGRRHARRRRDRLPHIMAVGATGDPRDAYTIGAAAAVEGRAVGIHVNFAPDADVNNNPANPIINTRSFGEDPRTVSRLVAAYVRGLHEHGMLATLKHFPGHGDTQTDSHIGLPVITAGYGRLDSLELVPFRAGIAAGADVVMSAHIAFPALTGSNDPATLSAAVLTGLLRDSLRFPGLVVTDALMMGAIVTKYGAGEATVRAFLAGSDLLLIPADPDSAVLAMTAAVAAGRVTPQRLAQSVRRALASKSRLGLFERRTVPLDSIPHVVGSKRFQDAANDIAVRSLTLVRDVGGRLHALRGHPGRLALIAYADEANSSVGQLLTELLRQGGDTVDYFRLWPMSGTLSYDSARATIARAPATVFVANVRPISGKGNIALPDSLAQLITLTDAARPTVLVSLGSPYLLNQTPAVRSYLIAWSGVRASERAVALALLGRVPLGGHLPTRIPPDYALGWGLTVPAVQP